MKNRLYVCSGFCYGAKRNKKRCLRHIKAENRRKSPIGAPTPIEPASKKFNYDTLLGQLNYTKFRAAKQAATGKREKDEKEKFADIFSGSVPLGTSYRKVNGQGGWKNVKSYVSLSNKR